VYTLAYSHTKTRPSVALILEIAPNTLSDEALMRSVSEGNLDNLKIIFQRYSSKLYSFFIRITMDDDLSNDLVQNVFLRILKYKNSYRAEQVFKSWFYQIARNVKNDHFKKNQNNLQSIDQDPKSFQKIWVSDGSEDLEKQERLQALHLAIARLPEDKREILVLSQLEEMEYKEIASVFGITENLARVRVHRAIQALKEIMVGKSQKEFKK